MKSYLITWIALYAGCMLAAQELSPSQQQEIVGVHNQIRKAVGVSEVKWSEELAASAAKWASYLAEHEAFEHSEPDPSHPVGENIWRGTPGEFSLTEMVTMWGDEKKDYRYQRVSEHSSPRKPTGHYTQIVWKTTTHVGCALKKGGDQYEVLVCQYSPPGNVIGEYPY